MVDFYKQTGLQPSPKTHHVSHMARGPVLFGMTIESPDVSYSKLLIIINSLPVRTEIVES